MTLITLYFDRILQNTRFGPPLEVSTNVRSQNILFFDLFVRSHVRMFASFVCICSQMFGAEQTYSNEQMNFCIFAVHWHLYSFSVLKEDLNNKLQRTIQPEK